MTGSLIHCIDCGDEVRLSKFVPAGKVQRCRDCQHKYNVLVQRGRDAEKRKPDYKPPTEKREHYTLILTAEPTGDFYLGSKFSILDVCDGHIKKLEPGVEARDLWEIGTTWRDEGHQKTWRVGQGSRLEEVRE